MAKVMFDPAGRSTIWYDEPQLDRAFRGAGARPFYRAAADDPFGWDHSPTSRWYQTGFQGSRSRWGGKKSGLG